MVKKSEGKGKAGVARGVEPVSVGRELVGMKEIRDYVRRSEATVLKMIRNYGMPAEKIEGIWMSDTAAIDEWRARRLREREAA